MRRRPQAQEQYYVADVERFTLLIDHAAQSPSDPRIYGSSGRMKGKLTACGGKVRKTAR